MWHKWVFWWNMHVTEMKSSSKEFLNTCKLHYHPCLCVLFIMEMMCKWISAKQRQAIGFQTITLSLPIFFLFFFPFYRFYFFTLFIPEDGWCVQHVNYGYRHIRMRKLNNKRSGKRIFFLCNVRCRGDWKLKSKGKFYRDKSRRTVSIGVEMADGKSLKKLGPGTWNNEEINLVRSGLSEELKITRGETMTALM